MTLKFTATGSPARFRCKRFSYANLCKHPGASSEASTEEAQNICLKRLPLNACVLLVRLRGFIAIAASWKEKGRGHGWRWVSRHPRVRASKGKAWQTSPSHSGPSRSPPSSGRQVGGTGTPLKSVPLGEP